MAILALLAYKTVKHVTSGSHPQSAPAGGGTTADRTALPGGSTADSPSGSTTSGPGGLGDILGNVLGGGAKPGAPSGGGNAVGNSAPAGGLGDILGSILGGGARPNTPGGSPNAGNATASGTAPAGGLSDLLKGGLGGLLAGGAAGTVLSGGLNDLLKQLQEGGQKDAADSWVAKGENKQIDPNDLAGALGADQISTLMDQTGLSRQDLLDGLSQYLPGIIDHLTPDGRVPSENELRRLL
nr:YidB family protein [Afipia sp. P52-10]